MTMTMARSKVIAACLCTLALISLLGPRQEAQLLRRLETDEKEDAHLANSIKPVIHTFFQPMQGQRNEGRDPLIDVWSLQWRNAGFEPVVLTVDDAKRHPYFKTMEEAVRKEFANNEYNTLCFYRYLAMAASGGGWMSDYDTFPTNFPLDEAIVLPNDGKFTSFSGQVPALLSASSDEWTRVAKLMAEAISRDPSDHPSDMFILKFLWSEMIDDEIPHDLVFLPNDDQSVLTRFQYDEPHIISCKRMEVGRAIHMSHKAIDVLKTETDNYPSNLHEAANDNKLERALLAMIYMEEWRTQCGGSKVANTIVIKQQ